MRLFDFFRRSMVTKLTALALATMLPVFLVNSIVLVLNESMEHTLQGVAIQGQARLAAIHGAHDSFLTWDGQANMWVGLGAGGANSTLGLQTLSQIEQARKSLSTQLTQLEHDGLDPQQLHLLDYLRSAVKGYNQIWNQVKQSDQSNHAEAALLTYRGNYRVSSEVRNTLSALEASITQANSSSLQSLANNIKKQNLGAQIMDFTVFFLMLISVFAIRSSMAPIKLVRDFLGRITKGDYSLNDTPSALKVAGRKDELGLLFDSSQLLARELSVVANERESHASKLEKIASFNATLAEAAQVLISTTTEQGMLDAICVTLVKNQSVLSAWIVCANDQDYLEVAASYSVEGCSLYFASSTDPSKPEGNNVIGRAWRKQRPVWSTFRAGGADPASWRREASLAGFHGCIALPIERDGKPWGVIAICLGPQGQGGYDKDLLETISDLTGSIALGFARMDSRLRELELTEIQKVLLETTFAGIGLVNDRHLVWANDRFTQIFGFENPNDLIGTQRAPLVDELDQELIDRAYGKLANTGSAYIANLRMRRQDGHEIICDVALGKIQRHDRVNSVVWTVQDVTDRKRLESQLQYQAEHDFLTGIPNRRSMQVQLKEAIERSKRAGSVCVLGVLDLDDFKLINDRFGHSAGDRLLAQFASRIKERLRSPDFFARLGGDEFVLILEGYDDLTVFRHLKRTFARLHKEVEEPFSLDDGIEIIQDVSMGVALYPKDADNPDDLFRIADGALYAIKSNKLNRSDWWGCDTDTELNQKLSISQSDAYSKLSGAILRTTQAFLSEVNQRFAVEFSKLLSQDRQASSVMSTLPDDGARHLVEQISSHLDFLFDPDGSRESRRERSWQVGQTHGLVGVEGTLLTHSVTLFRRILSEQASRSRLSPRQKHHLQAIAEMRLQDDLEAQLLAIDSLKERYSNAVVNQMPDTTLRWADLSKREMNSLSELPGVTLVLLLRLDNQKTFTIEKISGTLSAKAEEAIANFGIERASGTPTAGSTSVTQWRGPSIRSWEKSTIFSSGRFASDPEFSAWHEMAKQFDIRSILSIPVLDTIGRPVAGLVLFSKYPNQFESHWMKQFAVGVGNRFSELWRSRSAGLGEMVLTPEVANYYRECLFSGGFTPFFQPIVDLATGKVVSVEALARLKLPDGRIVPPGDFLPLLGELEMEQLFQLALDHSLAKLAEWDKLGLGLNISVNLSPTTLVTPDCANTIRSSLEKWSIHPSRLIVELLESERLDRQARDESIAKLAAIGIDLAMDDLGEGYSGLRRMSEVPFTTIKIDRSLMSNLIQRPVQTMVVIDTLKTMSISLGRKVVLEGLETEAHLEMAVLLGIPFGQGYWIAMPMPAEEIPGWIDNFDFKPNASLVRTYLGGLAHHWKFGHSGPFELCPLSLLFNINGGVPVEIRQLHAKLHSQDTTDNSSAELSDWLQREIQNGT